MSISWLWGGSNDKDFSRYIPPPPPPEGAGGGAGGDGGGDDKNVKGHKSSYSFDSTALERAAAAAKSLEQNSNAPQIIELTKQQEITKQHEIQAKAKEFELQVKHMERENLQEKLKVDKAKEEYHDQLARRREADRMQMVKQQEMERLEMVRRQDEDRRRRDEESVARQEAMRRETRQHELEMDLQKIERKVMAQGKVDRENKDVMLEQIRAKAKEERDTKLQSIQSIGSIIGTGLHNFLGDRQRVEMAVGGVVAVTAGYFFMKGSLSMAFRQLEARLAKPSLVRETSRLTLTDTLKHPVDAIKKIKHKIKGTGDALKGVVLRPDIEAQIRDIALQAKHTRLVNGNYSNVLLYGPPGTGKTLFAKKLALNSGMDYAIMTGGDVQIVGDKGVDSIHKMFDWARTSRRGLILFIDEAESFLTKRSLMLSHSRQEALSAFLNRTGEHNNKFMMVLASNLPEQIDDALLNRVYKRVEFPLPGLDERTQLIALHFQKYILEPAATGKWRIKLGNFDWTETCKKVAEMTEGMSGREIAHLALDWQAKTIISESAEITSDLMLEATKVQMEMKKKEMLWKKFNEKKYGAAMAMSGEQTLPVK